MSAHGDVTVNNTTTKAVDPKKCGIPTGLAYLRYSDGIIQILQVVACLGSVLGILLQPDKDEGEYRLYVRLAIVCGVLSGITTVFIILFILAIPQKTTRFPLCKVQGFYRGAAAVVLLIFASHAAANTYRLPGIIVAVVLSFVAIALNLFGIIFAVHALQRSGIAENVQTA